MPFGYYGGGGGLPAQPGANPNNPIDFQTLLMEYLKQNNRPQFNASAQFNFGKGGGGSGGASGSAGFSLPQRVQGAGQGQPSFLDIVSALRFLQNLNLPTTRGY